METVTMVVALALVSHVMASRGGNTTGRKVIVFADTRTRLSLKSFENETRLPEDSNTGFRETPESEATIFSHWSNWSQCSSDCEETRRRRCQKENKCGNSVHMETRPCPRHHTRRHKRKCHRTQTRRKHKHKHTNMHIVQMFNHGDLTLQSPSRSKNRQLSSISSSSRALQSSNHRTKSKTIQFPLDRTGSVTKSNNNKESTTSTSSSLTSSLRRNDRKLSETSQSQPNVEGAVTMKSTYKDSMVADPMRGKKHGFRSSVVLDRGLRRETGVFSQHRVGNKVYGRWGPWADCSRSCTTTRYRWCKRHSVCGNQVLKEAAYCYIEGSYCQHWINRKIQQNEENEADVDFHIENYSDRRGKGKVDRGNANRTDTLQYDSECGVEGSTNTRWSMLRIIGGRPTTKGRWPWQVAVLNRYKETFCGGTLVAPQWVLTAAHCIRKRLYVRLGEHDLSEAEGTETELRVNQMIPHPSYDPETVDNDVALLRLPLAVKPDRYRGLACLPKLRQALPTSQFCTIIGWGKRKSSDTFGTDLLHEAEVPIVPNDVCRNVYEDYHITHNMFCAGYRRGRMDSCAGDSGGPLLCKVGNKWTIFGITSFGEGCGKRGKYGIYTRLSNYVKWIQRTINGKKKY